MSLSEIEFAIFFPVVWLIYWAMPRKAPLQNAVLLAASYVFYATWEWRLLSLVIAGTLIDLAVVRALPATSTENVGRRRTLLAISLVTSLATLAFFKYALFFAGTSNDLFRFLGISASIPLLKIVLPLGISFYTLQRIGFVLDVYWGRVQPPQSHLAFAVFCCYFPQLTAGPIARGSELLVQLETPRRFDLGVMSNGAAAFLLGFALKAWAGDAIGTLWVSPVFANPSLWNATAQAFAVFGFLFQVFGDFAGYSLMAIGISRFLGIELPENFNYPLLSRSLPELWQRWHITLNRWLFDYLFTPLTTSQGMFRGRINTALLVTFLASGLWHGAAWTYVLWGALHGVGMVVHQQWDAFYRGLCRKDRQYVGIRKSALYSVACWVLTTGFFLLTLIPFRAGTLADAATVAGGLLGFAGDRGPSFGGLDGLAALSGAAFIVGYHLLELRPLARLRDAFLAAPPLVRGVAYGAALVFLLIFTPVGSGSFIYQQF